MYSAYLGDIIWPKKNTVWRNNTLGDPGAVIRAGRKGATKVFMHGRKSPWVPTLTEPFPNGQANAGSWLGTKNALFYFAQSANSISLVLFVCSYTTAIRELKQPRFWATHVNRKWPFFIFKRWFRPNFQSNRLYNSKEAKKCKLYVVKPC